MAISTENSQAAAHGSSRRQIPSPRSPGRELLRQPLNFFLTLTRQYGDIVCYRTAPETAYLVNHPDYIKHILVDNNRNYTKETYINQKFKTAVADGLLVSEGEAWRRQRRLMQPAFHHRRITNLAPLIVQETQAVLQGWESAAASGQPIDIGKEMAVLTLNITARVLFGVDFSDRSNAVGEAVSMAADLLEKPKKARFQNALQYVERVVYEIIAERRTKDEDFGDLLYTLMHTVDEESGKGMDDVQIRNQVITLLLAGYETTANALTWTWFLLAQNPEADERLHQEVRRVLGNRAPAETDLDSLSYTRMVFEEALRYYPPAWVLGRKALQEDEIDGYLIPAGAILAISPYTMHRHPGFWSEPERFIPERFSEASSAGRHRFAYLPFGGGPRQCIGNNLAMMEAQLILAMAAQRYHLSLVPGQDIQPEPLFILRPNREVLMTLNPTRLGE